MAAVVEDLVDNDTLEVLRSTSDELGSLRGMPTPGSLAAFGSSALASGDPIQTAVGGAIAIGFAVVGFAVAGVPGVVVLILAFVTLAGLMRRRSKPGR